MLNLGQKDDVVVSRDMIRTATRFSLATALIDSVSLLNTRLNAVFSALDPVQYQAIQNLRSACALKYTHMKVLQSIDSLAWEGRSIQYNRQTPLHADSTDPPTAWVALVALGEFKGGSLFIPRLNLVLYYEPGTIIFLRGHILPHQVLPFYGGQRLSIAHFTHESLWNEMGVACP